MVECLDISVEGLHVSFPAAGGAVTAVSDVSAVFHEGTFTAVIGESGCGKSILGQALLGILPGYAKMSGRVMYRGTDILRNAGSLSHFYGRDFGIVPQNPGDAMNPVRTVGKQMDDILDAAGIEDRRDALKEEWLHFFGMEETGRVLAAYPHELSGGMQQRVLCAMSMCCRPRWVLADEPTKGLDETAGGIVRTNLLKIKERGDCGMVVITHDILLARELCDAVAVMYAGQILEMGTDVFQHPRHPYTQAFLTSLPENGFQPMAGRAPSPGERMPGCRFAPRCALCEPRCLAGVPAVCSQGGARVRCVRYAEG